MASTDLTAFEACRLATRLRQSLWIGLATVLLVWASNPESVAADQHEGPETPSVTKDTKVLYPFCTNGKWGYIDKCGRVVVEPKFDEAHDFYEGLAVVTRFQTHESGYLRNDGSWAFKMPESSRATRRFSNGLAAFYDHKTGKLGYLDRAGRVAFTHDFDIGRDFSEGLAQVAIGKWINEMPSPRFEGKYGFIDREGKLVVPVDFDDVYDFSDGLARVHRGSEREFIDTQGRLVLSTPLMPGAGHEPSYFPHGSFHDGLLPVSVRGEDYGFMDKTGILAIPLDFEMTFEFSEGLAAVRKSGKYGFVNCQGQIVIAAQFDEADKFHEGFAQVKCAGQWFFVDRRRCLLSSRNCDLAGQAIGASPWNCVDNFHGGLARVHVGGTLQLPLDGGPSWHGGIWYYVNKQGFIVGVCHRDGESAGALGYWHYPL